MKWPKYIYIILLITIFAYPLSAQVEIELKQKATWIELDKRGDIYLNTNKGLLKYNKQGKLMHQYNNARLGELSSVDVSNPLEITLFYKETNTLVYLNHQLTEITDPIEIDPSYTIEALAITNALQGGYWVLNATEMVLLRIASNKTIVCKSENLNAYILSDNEIFISTNNQNIYLQNSKNILVFDAYATLIKQIPIATPNKVRFNGNIISYYSKGHWVQYNTLNFSEQKIKLPIIHEITNAIVGNDILLLQNNSTVKIITNFKLN